MSETFNFKRFWTFFRYDLKQMWRRNAKPAIFIGGSGLILLILWSFFSLICFFTWTTPPLGARIACLFVAYTILGLYMAKSYGFLTDRKKGSDYLMIPASTLEKFISLMIIVLIIIPFLFFAVYYIVDALICLAFPTSGMTLFCATGEAIDGISMANLNMHESMIPYHISIFGIFLFFSISAIYSLLFYTLCGMVFKRFKILWGLLISFVTGTIMSSVLSAVVGQLDYTNYIERGPNVLDNFFFGWEIIMVAAILAITAFIYTRLNKIQH